jgi:hypothetical protein
MTSVGNIRFSTGHKLANGDGLRLKADIQLTSSAGKADDHLAWSISLFDKFRLIAIDLV